MKAYLFVLCSIVWMKPTSEELQKRYVSDYKKIAESYKKKKSLSFKITYRSFSGNSSVPDTALSARYYLNGNNFFYKMGGKETYRNERYYVAVDYERKVIAVSYVDSLSNSVLPFQKMDTLLSKIKPDISYTALNNDKTGRYTIASSLGKNMLTIEFDKTTCLLNKYVTYMPNWQQNPYKPNEPVRSPYVEMLFSEYNNNDIDKTVFSTNKFFTEVKKGEVQLKAPYANYKLINSLPYNPGK